MTPVTMAAIDRRPQQMPRIPVTSETMARVFVFWPLPAVGPR